MNIPHEEISYQDFVSEMDNSHSPKDLWLKTNSDSDWKDVLSRTSWSSNCSTRSESEKNNDQDPSPSDTGDTDTH